MVKCNGSICKTSTVECDHQRIHRPSPGPIIDEIDSVDDINGDDDQSFRQIEEEINGDEEAECLTIVD